MTVKSVKKYLWDLKNSQYIKQLVEGLKIYKSAKKDLFHFVERRLEFSGISGFRRSAFAR